MRNNNKKTIADLITHFREEGVEVESAQRLRSEPLKCENALALTIAGRQLGVYKFNTRWTKAKVKLDKIRNKGYVYIIGVQFRALVNGSFVMIDYEKNKKRDQIIKAFESF